jgi:hypothetical protein
MNSPPITVAEVLSIIERLHPESLLLVRNESGLDEEMVKRLWTKVITSFYPRRRLENIEYLLLLMHAARTKDPCRYLHEVFLPWAGIKRRLYAQVMRILDDVIGTRQIEAYTVEDAAHIATNVYRPLVADIFDPFMTLLVASYQFVDGTFTNIHDVNVGSGERTKAELVTARIKRFGGPKDLLSGYDPIVRNALSHAGSEGVLYEPGSILFRSIKRGVPPAIETRRWTHDELHFHVIDLVELVMSIDAAVEVFSIDSMDNLSEKKTIPQVMFHAFGREQRLEIKRNTDERLQHIRTTEKLQMEERRDLLAKILFVQCADRSIPCSSVSFDEEHRLMFVHVPVEKLPVTDADVRDQAIFLIRYAILARAVFGKLFDRFRICGSAAGVQATSAELPGGSLDEYAVEKAGLIDLMADAEIWIDGGTAKVVVDEAALSVEEDARLGPRLPRRGRPISD